MDIVEFHKMLKSHDWYYQYANGNTYYDGQKSIDDIVRVLRSNKGDPNFADLFIAYKNAVFTDGGIYPVIGDYIFPKQLDMFGE